jgi:hypothetical protein
LDLSFLANLEDRVSRQGQEVDASGKDILAKRPWANLKALRDEFLEQLLMDEMDLPEIWLGRVGTDPGSVLYGLAAMGISVNPETFQEPDRRLAVLLNACVAAALTATTRPTMELSISLPSLHTFCDCKYPFFDIRGMPAILAPVVEMSETSIYDRLRLISRSIGLQPFRAFGAPGASAGCTLFGSSIDKREQRYLTRDNDRSAVTSQ